MSYTLYNHDGAGGAAIEIGLAMAGADFSVKMIDTKTDDHLSEAFTRINPWRQVPALELPDGTVLTESAAMAIHLAHAFPDSGLAPPPGTSDHATFLRWIIFMTVNIYEGDLRYYYPDRYTTDPNGHEAVKAAGVDHMRRAFVELEKALTPGPCFMGAELGIADVYLCMLRDWFPEPLETPAMTRLERLLRAHPVAGPIWARHASAE